jgi:hypothetical protein
MKRILFPGLLVAGLLISLSGFSQRYHGYHRGFGFPHARVFVRPILPAPVIYGPVYPQVYAPGYDYGYSRPYIDRGYHRPYYYGRPVYRGRSWRR